ncbi:hypothetical protein MUN78_10095 [Leucobacter allii]|uniref:Uncharacterized protein n=1 Tax=Leucobacter allii TaxID=2932247 RepID=A0ABY4FJD3_9MICO|nr:hypothetical protein [Leucobacter allii]UOQ56054.1 hypothetical protein MUN78_10095 [Leucobacter allii]
MSQTLEDLEALAARATAGDRAALQQILNPTERPGRIMPTWAECIRYPDGYHLGRNYLPGALWEAFDAGVLVDPAEVAVGIAEAWVMCEYPLLNLDPWQWDTLFDCAGFVTDSGLSGHGQQQPAPPTLYRSAHPDYLPGMSWTTDLQTAYWFACRNRRVGHLSHDGIAVMQVDTAACPWWQPLAMFTGRDEHEWVMPQPRRALPWKALSFHELDLQSLEWQKAAS